MKFGQIVVWPVTNISNMFLAECWRLEISCGPFYDFIKMTIKRDPDIFNTYLFNGPLFTFFKKMKL